MKWWICQYQIAWIRQAELANWSLEDVLGYLPIWKEWARCWLEEFDDPWSPEVCAYEDMTNI